VRRLEQRLEQITMGLAVHERRVSILIEAARSPARATEKLATAASEEADHLTDALYVAFEDLFRGSRADIKNRATPYLPYIEACAAGTPERPVLDIGCGRGEWLELLKENGCVATGVDTNRVMVGVCQSRGLDVVEADVVSYLRSCGDGVLGAVTGFHIVEHLSLSNLIAVLDEVVRVLSPGGIAIFETPNPGNVLVGSNTFYYDLTHRNPIPAPTLQFMAEARGLCHVQIEYLHPASVALHFPNDEWEGAPRLNEYFFGPQDYAIIARKASA
jgi:SAM-dependent methyltransferase